MQRFRLQVIGSLTTVIVLTIVVLISLAYSGFKSESVKQTKCFLREENHRIETELVGKFNAYRREISSISISATDISAEGLSQQAVTQLNIIYNIQKDISNGIFLFRENGDLYSKDGVKLDANVKKLRRSYYDALFNQEKRFFVSAPYMSSSNNKQVFGVAYKLTPSIAILSTIHTNVVLEPLANQRGMFMYSNNGTILSAPYPELLGKDIFQVRPAYKNFSERNPEISYSAIANGVESDYTAFWSQLDINGWGYVTFIKNSAINAPANEQLKTGILISIIGLLLVILILQFIINALILKPVGGAPKEIEKLMESIAQETPDPKLLSPTGNETGIYRSLILLFNRVSGCKLPPPHNE